MWNGQIWPKNTAKIFIFQSVNFNYDLVKNDYSLVTFNYSICHLQLTIRKWSYLTKV